MKHTNGIFESMKFNFRREDFYRYIEYLRGKGIDAADFMENFPAYVGHMSLHRFLTLYDLYKKVQNLQGHIAEVGVYKGAGSLFFAKLLQMFEPETLTMVHGFDWFMGAGKASENDNGELVPEGVYKADYEDVCTLIAMQKLDHILKIHKIDVITELKDFFSQHRHLTFKLVFMDAGMYDVMKAAIPVFYERLNPGGIMIFDQYNHELAPGETLAVREILGGKTIYATNTWTPNAYIIKE